MNTRIIAAIFIIFLLSSIFLTYFVHSKREEEIKRQVLEDFGRIELTHAQHLSLRIEKVIKSIQDDLLILGEIKSVRQADSSCSEVLRRAFIRLEYKISGINRVDLKGSVLCSSNIKFHGVNIASSPTYQNFLKTKKPLIGRAEISPDGIKHIAIYVPLQDGGKLVGALEAEIYLDEIQDKYLQQPGLRKETYAFIVDDDGTVLSYPDRSFLMHVLIGPTGSISSGNDELTRIFRDFLENEMGYSFYYYGSDKIAGYAPVNLGNGRKWMVGVTTPIAAIDSDISVLMRNIYKETIIIIGFLLAIGLAVTLFLKRWNDILKREIESKTRALKASKKKYKGLIETSTDAIISINEKGEIILWNRAAERILGYREDEILGKPLTIIIPEEYRKQHLISFNNFLKTRKPKIIGKTVELMGLRKDGVKFPIELSLSYLKTNEGYIFTAFIRDISHRKSLEKEIKDKHSELHKTYAKISALHRIGQVISRSLNLEEILRVALDEILKQLNADAGGIYLLEEDGKTLTLHFPTGLSDEFVKKLGKIKTGKGISGKAVQERKPVSIDISEYPTPEYENILYKEGIKSAASAPIFARGRVIGAITIGSKKERKFTSEDLELLGSIGMQLGAYIENSKLHEDLLKAYEELKSLDELKSNLIARVSHELRTPITIAKGALELAEMETDPEIKNRLIKMAIDALIRQNMIVGDLLEASMLERRSCSLNFEPVDVARAILLTVAELESMASKKNIKIKTKISKNLPKAWCDFDKLRHVLRNLIHNAIKFNVDGGKVIVEARKKKKEVEVCVIDTGIGIPEDKIDKIFDRFYQIDSGLNRRYSGTGMGLAIVKEIVESHGGRIKVKSKRKKGSTFCFTLPMATAD